MEWGYIYSQNPYRMSCWGHGKFDHHERTHGAKLSDRTQDSPRSWHTRRDTVRDLLLGTTRMGYVNCL